MKSCLTTSNNFFEKELCINYTKSSLTTSRWLLLTFCLDVDPIMAWVLLFHSLKPYALDTGAVEVQINSNNNISLATAQHSISD